MKQQAEGEQRRQREDDDGPGSPEDNHTGRHDRLGVMVATALLLLYRHRSAPFQGLLVETDRTQ